MPYDNPLNRSIAEQTRRNNEAYINNTLNSYDVAESNVGYANKKLLDESNIGQEQTRNEILEGGAYGAKGGFGKGTWRDTGFESVHGAGRYMNNEVVYENNPNNQFGGGFFSSIAKGLKSVLRPASTVLGMLPIPQAQLASKALGVTADLAGTGKKKRGRKPKDKQIILSRNVFTGGKPNKNDVGELMKVLDIPKKGRGRPKKMKGCGTDLAEPHNMIKADGTTGSGKPNQRIVGGRKLTPVANMHSSGMSGQGKTKGSRAELIKKIMKERGVSMIKASSIIKKENLY